jgi:hypothetical protein
LGASPELTVTATSFCTNSDEIHVKTGASNN